MYSTLLFTTSSHLSIKFVVVIPSKIVRSGIEEVEPVFKIISIVEDNAPYMVLHRVEKMVIRRWKIWSIRRLRKNLPFELLECDFDEVQHGVWRCCEGA
ncbi:hypothetical protein TNCV_3489311 [Trichonephila clavipes]|nr:hypothetical protein TNCV_3489311 [Trichonephila clavipes]